MKHRNCKQRVDGILATNAHHIGVHDVQVLIHEVEDVRAERDELLRVAVELVGTWDEAMLGHYGQPLTAKMEELRDLTPFELLRAEKTRWGPDHPSYDEMGQ